MVDEIIEPLATGRPRVFAGRGGLRIGMISLYLPSESKIGVGYQAHAMANAWVRRGWRVTMHSPCDRPVDALYDFERVAVGDRARTFRFAWELRKIDWRKFDVIHAHGDDYWLWNVGIPHVRTMHGSCLSEALHIPGVKEKTRMVLLGLSEVAAAACADQTVAVSRNTTRFYPWIRTVIPNGVDLSAFHPGAKEPTPTILFVGTYKNRKRGDLLQREFLTKIRPVIPEARLWMVCTDAPDAPGVTVFGRVPEQELAELYRRAWVFCLPSSYEGFGVPYIEAMASGTAAVATPNPGAVEVFEGGRYGVLTDSHSLGAAVLDVLIKKDRRSRFEVLGLDRVRHYGWDAVGLQYEQLYREIVFQR